MNIDTACSPHRVRVIPTASCPLTTSSGTSRFPIAQFFPATKTFSTIEPLASASTGTIVSAPGPTIQHYLSEDLGL
jgi:hypothetical protein